MDCSNILACADRARAVCGYVDLLALCELLELSPDGDGVAFPIVAGLCFGSAVYNLNQGNRVAKKINITPFLLGDDFIRNLPLAFACFIIFKEGGVD